MSVDLVTIHIYSEMSNGKIYFLKGYFMNSTQILLLCVCGAVFLIIAVLAAIGNTYSLKGIPNKPVGNGQHGTARFATKGEVNRTYKQIPYPL